MICEFLNYSTFIENNNIMVEEKKFYRSRKQSFIRGTNNPVEVKALRTIVIEGDEFTLELPDSSTVKGTLIFRQQDGDKTIY
jgi:hypothetical protein